MRMFPGMMAILIIIAIVGAGYYYYQDTYIKTLQETETTQAAAVKDPVVTPTPVPTSNTSIPNDWKSYRSDKYGFSIKHAGDIKIDSTSEGDRFSKIGPTQSLGTELYDGLSLTVRTGGLDGKSLQALAKEKYENNKKEPTTESITELKPVTYGSHQGFSFRRSSLGNADYIYIEKSPTEYLEIINRTVEPNTREQTYQKIVDIMLSSLSF